MANIITDNMLDMDDDYIAEEYDEFQEEAQEAPENEEDDDEDIVLDEDDEIPYWKEGNIANNLSVEHLWKYDGDYTYRDNEEILRLIRDENTPDDIREQLKSDFVKINAKLVYKIMHQLKKKKKVIADILKDDDFKSAGFLGITKAMNTYNPEYTGGFEGKKSSFATYAYTCISNEITQLINAHRAAQMHDVSMEKGVGRNKDGGEGLKIEDTIPDSRKTPDEVLDTKVIRAAVRALIDTLPPLEKFVLYTRYSLTKVQMTQREIADYLDMSQANVSKIERTCLKELRKRLEAK